MSDRPSKLRIGSLDYTIEWVDGNWSFGTDRYGECDLIACIIRINGTIAPTRVRECFIHEVAHAGLDAMGYKHDADNKLDCEECATWNGLFWPGFWRDNPQALQWWLEQDR